MSSFRVSQLVLHVLNFSVITRNDSKILNLRLSVQGNGESSPDYGKGYKPNTRNSQISSHCCCKRYLLKSPFPCQEENLGERWNMVLLPQYWKEPKKTCSSCILEVKRPIRQTNKVSSAYCFETSHNFWVDFNYFWTAASTGVLCLCWIDDISVLNQFPADRERIAIYLIVLLLQTSRRHFWSENIGNTADSPLAIGSLWENHVVYADLTPRQRHWVHNHSQCQLSPHAFCVL